MQSTAKIATLTAALFVTAAGTTSAQDADPVEQVRNAFRNAVQRVMIPNSTLTDGPQVRAAFRDAVAEAAEATVEVRDDGKRVAFGGIVGRDGWVVTKADVLKGPVTCRLKDGRELDARLVGVDRKLDLAMLKVDAKELPVLNLKRSDDAEVGEWVATVSTARDPIAVGVVSVDTRSIRPQRGWLGIQMDVTTNDPRVTMVFEESAAQSAGMQVNDLIVEINGEPTPTREKLFRTIGKYSPGDLVKLKVKREGETLPLQAVLTPPVKGMGINERSRFQNSLGSTLSNRRFGFNSAFQHDTVLKPIDCGGPLVDLEGRVVGFNIARSGRTESYAIPANVAVGQFFDLMSGNLTPIETVVTTPASKVVDEVADEEQAETQQ